MKPQPYRLHTGRARCWYGIAVVGVLSENEIEALLRDEVVGRVACSGEGRIYVVPITYAYDDGCAYAHSEAGLKIRLMRKNPHVCFEIDRIENPAEWSSVVAWGTFEELHGAEADRGMLVLVNRFARVLTSRTALPPEPARSGGGLKDGAVIYRLRLTEKTGRFERRAP